MGDPDAVVTPTTDNDALMALKDADPAAYERVLAQRYSTSNLFDSRTSKKLADSLEIDPAMAEQVLFRQQFPLERDSEGNFLFTNQPQRDYLMPGRHLIRTAEETVPGAEAAAADLLAHIQAGDKISIFADYDPDGTSSSEVMRLAMQGAGASDEQLHWQWAKMEDGFGLKESGVRAAHENGANVLITLDCGSTQSGEVQLAKDLGMKVIVIDHHGAEAQNAADHHLNPEFINLTSTEDPLRTIGEGIQMVDALERARQQRALRPDDADAKALVAELQKDAKVLREQLDVVSGTHTESTTLPDALAKAKKAASGDMLPNTNSAAQLTWKVGGEMLRQTHGEVPENWYREPLYTASIGALADSMPMDASAPENRAFVRVPTSEHFADTDPRVVALADQTAETLRRGTMQGESEENIRREALGRAKFELGREAAPHPAPVNELTRQLAEHFEEVPGDQSSTIRTRAAMNEPKRTTRVHAELVGKGLRSQDPAEVAKTKEQLVAHYETGLRIREEMNTKALDQYKAAKEKDPAAHEYVASALLTDFQEDAGRARLIAMNLTKESGTTGIVGVQRPDGAVKVSLSGVFSAQIGTEYKNNAQIRARVEKLTQRESTDINGTTTTSSEFGGHAAVLSGVCQPEDFPAIVAAFNDLGEQVVKKGGNWIVDTERKPIQGVRERLVSPQRLHTLAKDARMISPTGNGNRTLTVSAAVRGVSVSEPTDDRGVCRATLQLLDGSTVQADVSKDAVPAMRTGGTFEAALMLRGGSAFVTSAAVIPS